MANDCTKANENMFIYYDENEQGVSHRIKKVRERIEKR